MHTLDHIYINTYVHVLVAVYDLVFCFLVTLLIMSNFQGEIRQKVEKWRLFYAKDFQSLYSCFMMCRILRIFPYKMNDSTFKVSKSYYILSIIIICVYNIYALMAMYYIYTVKIDIKIFF